MNDPPPHNDVEPGDLEPTPKHRWYQFSLLEMLLVTTIVAEVLAILNLFDALVLWLEYGLIFLIGFNLYRAFLWFRRQCIENDIWYPDPVETKYTSPIFDGNCTTSEAEAADGDTSRSADSARQGQPVDGG